MLEHFLHKVLCCDENVEGKSSGQYIETIEETQAMITLKEM